MQPDKLVKIIIPIYTTTLKQEEWSSIDRCFSLLGKKYEIAFAVPEGLDIELLHRRYQNFSVHPFTPSFFKGLEGYNQMMLSPEFYKSFLDYEYILIYQTDAYVFKDDLSAWCLKGYDYIGAPWIPKKKYMKWYYHLYFNLKKIYNHLFGASDYTRLFYKVGNGGFSLRRVSKFYDISLTDKETISLYLSQCHRNRFNEDVFWGIEVNNREHRLHIPSWREALAFSFDKLPEDAFVLHGKQLPFGCHGWNKPAMRNFWKNIIPVSTDK